MATGFTAAFSKSAARDQEQEDDYHPPFSMEGRHWPSSDDRAPRTVFLTLWVMTNLGGLPIRYPAYQTLTLFSLTVANL